MVAPLLAAGVATSAVASVAGLVGGSKRDRARRRAIGNIIRVQNAFLDEQQAFGEDLAEQLRGLGLESDQVTMDFLQRRNEGSRTAAGDQARFLAEGEATQSLAELQATIPGLEGRAGIPPSPGGAFDRALQSQAIQTGTAQQQNLDIFGGQAQQQGLAGFDVGNRFNQALGLTELGARGQDITDLAQLGSAERSLANQREMIALNAALGRADQAGGGLSTIGALGNVVGSGLVAAGAFQQPAAAPSGIVEL